jgi:hypothetical protein
MRQGVGAPVPLPGVRHGGSWTPPAGPGGRREVPEPGPSTGAWNPFVDDDEGDEVGSATVPGSPAVTPAGPAGGRQPARTAAAIGSPAPSARPSADEHSDEDDPDLDEHDHDDTGLDALDDSGLDDSGLDASGLDDSGPPLARSWAGVVAQWLTGAVVGAVLWVLFRYLWRGLPVVAFAAALLVTAGLVVGVRQVLHDVDRRTTAFAVLVGLLLTASPAVLVLLGR